MGGGGIMKTAAAKIAKFSFLGTPSSVPTENQECKSSTTRRPSWEIDDWDFADQEEEVEFLSSDSIQIMPSRVIFGGVPTLEEAQEATSDLKDAFDDICRKSLGYEAHESETSETNACITTATEAPVTIPEEHESETSETKACVTAATEAPVTIPEEHESETSETKACVNTAAEAPVTIPEEHESEASETKACVTTAPEAPITIPSESGPIFQAFSLLKESPAAQSVVASLASDKNVWDAVMGNEKVTEFLKLHQTDNEFHEYRKPSMCFEDVKQTEGLGDALLKSVDNLKLKVLEMMTSLSTFFQDLFGGQASGSNIHLDDNGNARATFVDRIKGSSFMALAIMVIMVVIMKRRKD